MERYKQLGPRDSTGAPAGDSEFRGVFMVAADKIPPGFVASAENCVFDRRAPETRPGKWLLPWLNRLSAGRYAPWQTIHGYARFRDPNRREWQLIAADGGVYRAVENNSVFALSLPAGCIISGPVTFLQYFGRMILQQGVRLPNLVLSDIGSGFALAVLDWDPATIYVAGDIRAYGTELKVSSITSAGSLATVTTASTHDYQTGDRVYIYFETRAELNGAYAITVLTDTTFTFNFANAGSAIAPVAVTSITRVATTATVTTTAPHGLVTGRRVILSGADQPEYNIEAAITVTGGSTFTYAVTGAPADPATGTITLLPVVYASRQTKFYKASNTTVAGESPVTTTAKWTDWTDFVAPWTLGGIMVQNRAVYQGARESSVPQKDLVAISEIQEFNTIIAQKNELRINQGDSDELVQLVPFNKRSFMALKRNSIYPVGGIYGDLTNITLDRLPASFGLAARRAAEIVGGELWILTGEPAVRAIYLTQQNEVLNRELPLSLPIEPLMRRINSRLLSGAAAAFCRGKYHLAVPLDDARAYGAPGNYSSSGVSVTLPLNKLIARRGALCRLTIGAGHDCEIWNGTTRLTGNGEFTPVSGILALRSNTGHGVYNFTVEAVYIGNNAILTYNTKTEAWEGEHFGEGIAPIDFATCVVDGRERVTFSSQDGCIYLWGEGRLDVVFRPDQSSGAGLRDIEMEVLSRGYDFTVAGLKRFTHARAALATWHPAYTVAAKFDGVNEWQDLTDTDVTRSRLNYFDPWDRTPYRGDNLLGDHGDAGREDYSIDPTLTPQYLETGAGADFERDQEFAEVNRISHGRRDRVGQIRVRNTQGYVRVDALEITGEAGAREEGIHA